MSSSKRYGVRLSLPGAPGEPHEVPGLHLIVYADRPTEELDQEQVRTVRALIADGADLVLVDLDKQQPGLGQGGRAKKPDPVGPQPDEVAAEHSETTPGPTATEEAVSDGR